MSILAVHETPTLTRERYEAVIRRLTGGRARIDSVELFRSELQTTGSRYTVLAKASLAREEPSA